jgi:hypothetical protein
MLSRVKIFVMCILPFNGLLIVKSFCFHLFAGAQKNIAPHSPATGKNGVHCHKSLL